MSTAPSPKVYETWGRAGVHDVGGTGPRNVGAEHRFLAPGVRASTFLHHWQVVVIFTFVGRALAPSCDTTAGARTTLR